MEDTEELERQREWKSMIAEADQWDLTRVDEYGVFEWDVRVRGFYGEFMRWSSMRHVSIKQAKIMKQRKQQ
jgi:hypothetical protein